MNTINQISKEICTGCSACSQICPNQCISMVEDSEGFPYPNIDKSTCIECSMCYKSCPVNPLNNHPVQKIPQKVFAAWNTDPLIRKESSSGGTFSALAQQILEQDGIVFGAAFNDSFKLQHCCIETTDHLSKLRGSKYIQSSINGTFKKAEQFLKSGKKILFSGTPCQIAGLRSFLNNDYSNLFTCDIICAGVPSPKVFEKYKKYQEERIGSTICKLSFRDKSIGWKSSILNIKFNSKHNYSKKLYSDPFGYGFGCGLFLRPVCYQCSFNNFKNKSDITLGDFWGIGLKRPDLDDDCGTSLILINNNKGLNFFAEISSKLKYTECDLKLATNGNPRLISSKKYSIKRKKFFQDFNTYSFAWIVKHYLKRNNFSLFVNKLNKIIKNNVLLRMPLS